MKIPTHSPASRCLFARRALFTLPFSGLTLLTGMLLSGCQAPAGFERAESGSSTAREISTEVAQVRESLGEAASGLEGLSAGSVQNPREQLGQFTAGIEAANEAWSEVTAKTDALRAEVTAYLDNWEDDIVSLHSEEMRSNARQRWNDVREVVDEFQNEFAEVSGMMNPTLARLESIRQMLANDLTTAGIRAAATPIEEARAEVEETFAVLERLQAEANRVASALAPAVAVSDGSPGTVRG